MGVMGGLGILGDLGFLGLFFCEQSEGEGDYLCMANDTIYSRFKQRALRQPGAAAIVTDDVSATYAELDARADAIAASLGDRSGGTVGIVMSHGIDMIAAMLGVLKAGAAYVPAEPSLPKERIDYMMQQAGADPVITDDYCRGVAAATTDSPDRSKPDGTAYTLYTSGTTGRPKGVRVTNANVVNYAEAFEAEFHTAPGDVMLQYSVCSFDIFVEEVFTTLLNGATLAIPSAEVMAGGLGALMAFVERHKVTEISGFPYLLAEMNKLERLPRSLRLLISGGDVLRASYIDRLLRAKVRIYNTYGPSETTVCATYFRCDNARALADGTFPIGKAVKGVSVKVVDDDGREAPEGIVGEICIYGRGVSQGYTGNPPEQRNFGRTAEGKPYYRSGDMGYRLPDGNLAFLHRRDKQVMILGKRVEPDEVENVLNTSPEVERGVVRAFKDESGLAYLVAYFVPRGKRYSLHDLKEWLRRRLTDFMIPEFFVALADIPVNRRGKVDVAALPVVLKEGQRV